MIDPIGTEHLPLFDTPAPHFDGVSYEPEHDGERLTGLLGRVYHTLTSGQWYTLSALVETCGGSEAGVSARLRDLRKRRFGATRSNASGSAIRRPDCGPTGSTRVRRDPAPH